MHYIRLLRPPTIERGRGQAKLKVAFTINTDLSDAYLNPPTPVELCIIGATVDPKGNANSPPVPVDLTQRSTPTWRAGMRVLKLELPLPLPLPPITTIQIRPRSRLLTALAAADIYPQMQPLILPVYADLVAPDAPEAPEHLCFRSLRLPGGDPSAPPATLQVEEEMGESMARHVWDGGITAACFLADMCLGSASPSNQSPMPVLSSILRQSEPLSVVEVGCGVGTLGVGLARLLGPSSHVLLTDLPDAEARARANIARGASHTACSVDFESLDWEDGKDGNFGPKVQSRKWDLVVLSDCTYNVDSMPLLVQTLSALHAHNSQQCTSASLESKVLLATKQRHSTEKVAFDLLAAGGWLIQEQTSVTLPCVGSETQSVEVYLLSKA